MLNVVVLTGYANFYSLSEPFRNPGLVINTTSRAVKMSRSLVLNLQQGNRVSRAIKTRFAVFLIWVLIVSRIPIVLKTPHLVIWYANVLAFKANTRELHFLYDGTLNISEPPREMIEDLLSASEAWARRFGLHFTRYEGDLIGSQHHSASKTIYPGWVSEHSGLTLPNEAVELACRRFKANPLLLFIDQPLDLGSSECEKVAALVSRLVRQSKLDLVLLRHPRSPGLSPMGQLAIDRIGGRVVQGRQSAEAVFEELMPRVVVTYSSTAVINIALMNTAAECYLVDTKGVLMRANCPGKLEKGLSDLGILGVD